MLEGGEIRQDSRTAKKTAVRMSTGVDHLRSEIRCMNTASTNPGFTVAINQRHGDGRRPAGGDSSPPP